VPSFGSPAVRLARLARSPSSLGRFESGGGDVMRCTLLAGRRGAQRRQARGGAAALAGERANF